MGVNQLYYFKVKETDSWVQLYTKDDLDEGTFFVGWGAEGKLIETKSFGRESFALHLFWDKVAGIIETRHGEIQ